MVKLLITKCANKDIRNKAGKTAYNLAAENGHSRLFDALKLGDSFCVAARKGEVRTIHKLLESGAVINGRDQHGWTALHRAAFKGRVDAVRALLEKGIDVDAKDEDGYTALHCAVESGHADVIQLLVKKGADVAAGTNKRGTALQIAESLHHVGIARVLIHGGATKEGGVTAGSVVRSFEKYSTKELVKVVVKRQRSRGRALRGVGKKVLWAVKDKEEDKCFAAYKITENAKVSQQHPEIIDTSNQKIKD
ncbi:protein VAPYRIN-like [Tripterygium wilfordii]|uniref:protein VAPYRIN-like n=1 Tax=Tripterygium wilfordii TaxID=458696 RepID=UPI0018F7E903|nr:protein VAPYRIN-like [Tripterygium wilfordii]